MEQGLLTVGLIARRSGLTVKALRHYDRVGLLRPVTVDPATGNIWAADFWGSGIHEFSPSGSTTGMYEIDGSPAPASGFSEAYGVAVGPDGTTYVADRLNQRIEEFSSTGAYENEEGSRGVAAGQYSWPEAVAVTPDKTVWVGDTRNGRLQHFTNASLTGTPAIIGSNSSSFHGVTMNVPL